MLFIGRNETLVELPPVFDDLNEYKNSDAAYSSSFGTQFSIILTRKIKQISRNTVSKITE